MSSVKVCVKHGLSASTPAQFIPGVPKTDAKIDFIIQHCLEVWKDFNGKEDDLPSVVLRFNESDQVVNEDNQNAIVDGTILVMDYSTPALVTFILESLANHEHSGADVLIKRLKANDPEFTDKLVADNGVKVVIDRVLYDLATHEESKMINDLLEALCLLANKSNSKVFEALEVHSDKLVVTLAEEFSLSNLDHSRILHASHFLTFIQKSINLYAKVTDAISIESLVLTVLSKELPEHVKFAVLALLNELILNNTEDRYQLVQILERHDLAAHLGKQFKHVENKVYQRQLYFVQCWTLLRYQKLMNTLVDSQDQRAVSMIKELRKIALERNDQHIPSGMMVQRARFADDYKTLGFDSTVDPTQDFQKPPGLLALQLMHEFASNNEDMFNKLVMESSCLVDDCPFAKSCIGLVKVLCEIFRIDQDPMLDKGSISYCHFILVDDQSFFAKVFSICIQHLFRTWRDMRASSNDFDKVMEVTKDQLMAAMKKEPQTLEAFKNALPSYADLSESWQNANKRKGEEDCEAIQRLKEVLKPDILDLILAQRLNYICEGTLFTNQRKGHSKMIFVKLSANKKTLCYDEWTDKSRVPEIEDLRKKILVSDIKGFYSGAECLTISASVSQNSKDARRRNDHDKYLTILSANDQLELIVPDDKDKAKDAFDYWCDAINALMGREMKSKKLSDDLDLLLGHEVRLRLLDIEDVKLPDLPPPIPPLPPSFDIESC